MRIIILLALLAAGFSSCTTAEFIQHTPTLANTGQHTDKDQFTGKLLYSTGSSSSNSIVSSSGPSPYEKVRGIQTQGSYSVSNALAVQASYMHGNEEGGTEESNKKSVVYKYNRNITEAGLAWYKNLDQEKKFFIEIGTGTGFGRFKTTEVTSVIAPGGRFYDHSVLKLYLQPSVYYVTKNFCFSSGFKLAHINFNNIETNYSDLERTNRSITTEDKLSTTTLDYFVKGDAFLSELPWIGVNFQFLRSSDLGKKFNLNQTDSNFGIGLCFRFGQFAGAKK